MYQVCATVFENLGNRFLSHSLILDLSQVTIDRYLGFHLKRRRPSV